MSFRTRIAGEDCINRHIKPTLSLPRSKYTFIAPFLEIKWPSWDNASKHPFYSYNQSCVSFVHNLIEMADPKEGMRMGEPYGWRVTMFETIVREHYMGANKNDSCPVM
jgi:hypothetical protein